MGGLRADPRLLEAARLLHALEAVRQDARNALLAAAAALVAAVDAGHEDSADIVRADCAALEARIAEIDAAIEDAWRAGVRQAAAIADWAAREDGRRRARTRRRRRRVLPPHAGEGDLDAAE